MWESLRSVIAAVGGQALIVAFKMEIEVGVTAVFFRFAYE